MLFVKKALSAQALVCLEQLKALDLSPIGAYLMNPKNGYCWTTQQTFQAINRYKTFLFISYLYPQILLVPTQEIDCVWHCHILHTRKYRQDCIMLFDQIIDHEPDTERSDEVHSPQIEAAFAQTQALLALFEGYFDNTASLVQEGRRKKAEGRREERLYTKLFNLFGLVGDFCRAVLAAHEETGNGQKGWILSENFNSIRVPATFRTRDYSTLHPSACGRPLT